MNSGSFKNAGGLAVLSREALGYALVAAAVWLSWEVVKAPLVQRGTVGIAARLAPQSPEVLRRAAEVELQRGRAQSAKELADASLVRAPFNASALRVRGLAEAQLGNVAAADQILTLAGNWSLRDDPTHAWLVENRLRRGNYGSAFAHADTLARRRPDIYPRVFSLFTVAAATDPRALPYLAQVLGAAPPWRQDFFEYLYKNPKGAPVLGALALALERTPHPLTARELQKLYSNWTAERRFQGLWALRERLGRPPLSESIQNGDFSIDLETQSFPFGWQLGGGPGLGATLSEDDLRSGDVALRVEFDGFGSGVFTEQLLLLRPGTYGLSGEERVETPATELRMAWRVRCAESNAALLDYRPGYGLDEADSWHRFSARFVVPAENCSAQWLRLEALPDDRKTTIAVWFDALKLNAAPTL